MERGPEDLLTTVSGDLEGEDQEEVEGMSTSMTTTEEVLLPSLIMSTMKGEEEEEAVAHATLPTRHLALSLQV